MKTKKLICMAIGSLPFIVSCTSMQTASNETDNWRINPHYSVNNSAQSADSLYQLGRYYQGQQRYQQALVAYQRAIAVDAAYVEAHNGMGVVLALLNRHDESITAFRAAISQDKKNSVHLYNNLGHALYLKGEYVDAIFTLEIAAALDPANTLASENLAKAYAQAQAAGKLPQQLAQTVERDLATETAGVSQESSSTELAAWETAEPLRNTDIYAAMATTEIAENPQEIVQAPLSAVKNRIETVRVAPNIYEMRPREMPANLATAEVNTGSAAIAPTSLRLEVSNGNGVTGFAKRMGTILADYGFDTARLTNQKPFTVPTSQIQYRPGFLDEAQRLQATLPGKTSLIQTDKLRQGIQARLLLGKDMVQQIAALESQHHVQLASTSTTQTAVLTTQ